MDVVITGSKINESTFVAPPSKSYTHRAYAIASLAEGASIIRNPLRADDTDSTLDACKAFGADVKSDEERVVIKGTKGRLETPLKELYVGNSGTTLRLFTSIATLNGRVTLSGDESIQKRPMQPLIDALMQLGVGSKSLRGDGKPPVIVEGGGIEGGVASIRGDISSQFISSLLIASPYARNPVTVELTTDLKSSPYVDVTLDIMKTFGVEVENSNYDQFRVPVGFYRARDITIEGDYSSASYLLSLAALCKTKITVEHLPKKSVQGDTAILKILNQMGAKVKQSEGKVIVEADNLKGIDLDLGNSPDLLPTVTALACAAKGKTYIKNIEHARLKESDRVSASAREFSKFGAKIVEKKDSILIIGTDRLRGGKVNSFGDHRMVMALAILGVCAQGETVIDNAESVSISFPGFFKALKKTGAKVNMRK
jgi:3-phosphoshikimate 1-carboxyvinyltransferase